MDKKSKYVICTHLANGKQHDFKVYQRSKIKCAENAEVQVDSGYQGITNYHANANLPKKKTKKGKLTKAEKMSNKELSSSRVTNEHVIGKLKIFKIIADRYRNRRRRFGLRFNLIAGFYNFELNST